MVLSGRPISPGCTIIIAAAAMAALVLAAVGYRNAIADPIVRHLTIEVSGYSATAAPVRMVLLSDLHVRGPDMPPARLARIVDQVNTLNPNIAVIAGDFTGHSWIGAQYSPADATGPLRRLKARFGTFAVLGNNDSDVPYELLPALRAAGVHLLVNDVARAGPVALGGVDGRLTPTMPALNAARMRTYSALERTPGVKVLVTHRPDEFPGAPKFVTLVLAGHTHCGQIVLPMFGALVTGSDYGRKYACGVYRDGSKILVVTAGLGTSHLPLRLGAPPDIWLISIRGTGV